MAWRITDYNMQSISHKTNAEINSQYNLLKSTVERQVREFEKHGMGKSRYVREARLAIGDNKTIRDRMHAIIDMKRFISSGHSSYSQHVRTMEKTIEYWKQQGIEGLDMDNIDEFLDFLDWTRSFYGYYYKKDSPYPPSIIEEWNVKLNTSDLQGLIDFFSKKMFGNV